MKKNDPVLLGLVVLGIINLIITGIIFPAMPEIIPTHWGITGEIDAWSPKYWVFLFAGLPLLMSLLSIFIPKIDPKKENYEKHWSTYRLIITLIIIFLILLHWIMVSTALGIWMADVAALVPGGIGVLFLIMGNYLPRIRHNYTIGIRLPWTLTNEIVWKKIHRLGGGLMMILGLTLLGSVFFPPYIRFTVLIVGLVAFLGGTSVYSYYIFKKVVTKN